MKNKEFKKLGFKKKWLPDKSGYWWVKRMNKYFTYYVDEGEGFKDYELQGLHNTLITFKNLKELLKSAERFKFEY